MLHRHSLLTQSRYLLAEKAFEQIDIWEQRDRVGGIWNLSGTTRSRTIPLPQTDPRYGQRQAKRTHDDASLGDSLEFESPLYDYLETNIPKGLMAYSDKPFADEDPLFPSHTRVLEYLEEYAGDVKPLIKFRQQVVDLRSEGKGWQMVVESCSTRDVECHQYDAVVVANGHYTVPSVPHIEGLRQWNEAYPGRIIHSKAYRKPEDYKDQKVLVIGNSASGLDIAYQVAQEARKPVVLSSRSASIFGSGPPPEWRQDVDEIVEFLPSATHDRAVRCHSGHVEEHIDTVIFCTGFFYSFPFMSDFKPPIITDGLRTRDVYRDLFHIEHPSLVFPVINLKVIPFPLAENQAAVTARVWSGRATLPSKKEMRAWEAETMQSNGDGKYFHLKKFPGDCAQINYLYDWASSASIDERLENDGQGKMGGRWGRDIVWLRSQFAAIKQAYLARGRDRVLVKTVEELGFGYDKWLDTASEVDKQMFENAGC